MPAVLRPDDERWGKAIGQVLRKAQGRMEARLRDLWEDRLTAEDIAAWANGPGGLGHEIVDEQEMQARKESWKMAAESLWTKSGLLDEMIGEGLVVCRYLANTLFKGCHTIRSNSTSALLPIAHTAAGEVYIAPSRMRRPGRFSDAGGFINYVALVLTKRSYNLLKEICGWDMPDVVIVDDESRDDEDEESERRATVKPPSVSFELIFDPCIHVEGFQAHIAVIVKQDAQRRWLQTHFQTVQQAVTDIVVANPHLNAEERTQGICDELLFYLTELQEQYDYDEAVIKICCRIANSRHTHVRRLRAEFRKYERIQQDLI